ncbi:MAG: hypothetical protein M3Q99_11575 [Acidobacteriota bacterium]|nr:hypothetical protein [Acidobacteriota bacterium]
MYYSNEPVYTEIQNRFSRFSPRINIGEHIDSMTEIGRTVSEGITFKPINSLKLKMDIAFTNLDRHSNQRAFHWDNRKVWIYKLAALATDGEGYREIGTPSLHCAINEEKCNIHIDEFGFIARTDSGEEYLTPDLIRHIGDELILRDKIRKNAIKFLKFSLPDEIAEPAAKLLDHTYFVVPSSQDGYGFDINNKFKPRIGLGFKIWNNKIADLRFEYTCGNSSCSDTRKMVWLSLDFDKL